MRRRKYYKTDRRGQIICMLITAFIFMLSVGYAALNENLTISGEAHFRVEADIRITDVSLYTTTYSALEDYNSSFGKDSMKVGVTLPSNNSSVTYKVTVTNYGNVAMQLKSITKEIENNNYNITFNKTLPLTIGKTSSEEIEITFKNSTNESQTINANLLFTFAKEEAVMARGNANASTSTFYNGPLTKDSIESITFMPTKEIPEDAIGYWDASEVQGTNKVMAYYLNSETEGMYDLYIAADGEVYAPTNSSSLFENFTKVTSINFNNSFNTSKVTNMYKFLCSCSTLSELLSMKFNTSKVTNMSFMFYNCSSLTSLDVSSFDTSNVTIFSNFGGGMFNGCSSLKTLDLSGFNTKKASNMNSMFNGCSKLESVSFGINFDLSNVTSMGYMFQNCSKLTSLDLSSFNTSKVTNMESLFKNCTSLVTLNLDGWDTVNVTTMSGMFWNCQQLQNLDLSSFRTPKLSNIGGGSINTGIFTMCSSLKELDLHNWDVSNIKNMGYVFSGCSKLKSLNLEGWAITSVTSMSNMFQNCKSLLILNVRNMDFENKSINVNNIFFGVPSGINIYVLNEYNKTFIQGLNSNANVIIYVSTEEEVEEG